MSLGGEAESLSLMINRSRSLDDYNYMIWCRHKVNSRHLQLIKFLQAMWDHLTVNKFNIGANDGRRLLMLFERTGLANPNDGGDEVDGFARGDFRELAVDCIIRDGWPDIFAKASWGSSARSTLFSEKQMNRAFGWCEVQYAWPLQGGVSSKSWKKVLECVRREKSSSCRQRLRQTPVDEVLNYDDER